MEKDLNEDASDSSAAEQSVVEVSATPKRYITRSAVRLGKRRARSFSPGDSERKSVSPGSEIATPKAKRTRVASKCSALVSYT